MARQPLSLPPPLPFDEVIKFPRRGDTNERSKRLERGSRLNGKKRTTYRLIHKWRFHTVRYTAFSLVPFPSNHEQINENRPANFVSISIYFISLDNFFKNIDATIREKVYTINYYDAHLRCIVSFHFESSRKIK